MVQSGLPEGASATRYPTLLLGLIAGVLGFVLMVQCAIGVMVTLVVSSPPRLGKALTYLVVGLAPLAAALGAWLFGDQEPEQRVRAFKTVVITLAIEAVVIVWLSTQGVNAVNVEWVHWL